MVAFENIDLGGLLEKSLYYVELGGAMSMISSELTVETSRTLVVHLKLDGTCWPPVELMTDKFITGAGWTAITFTQNSPHEGVIVAHREETRS